MNVGKIKRFAVISIKKQYNILSGKWKKTLCWTKTTKFKALFFVESLKRHKERFRLRNSPLMWEKNNNYPHQIINNNNKIADLV